MEAIQIERINLVSRHQQLVHFEPRKDQNTPTMDYSVFNPQNIETVGTSYYYSSLQYLGYSTNTPQECDVKPNLWWVSALYYLFCLIFLQATYANNPIALYMAVRHCLEQEMIIVQKVGDLELRIIHQMISDKTQRGPMSGFYLARSDILIHFCLQDETVI